MQKVFLTRVLFWMTNLFLLYQTPQLLGMMGITPLNLKNAPSDLITIEKLNLKEKYWYSLQLVP